MSKVADASQADGSSDWFKVHPNPITPTPSLLTASRSRKSDQNSPAAPGTCRKATVSLSLRVSPQETTSSVSSNSPSITLARHHSSILRVRRSRSLVVARKPSAVSRFRDMLRRRIQDTPQTSITTSTATQFPDRRSARVNWAIVGSSRVGCIYGLWENRYGLGISLIYLYVRLLTAKLCIFRCPRSPKLLLTGFSTPTP